MEYIPDDMSIIDNIELIDNIEHIDKIAREKGRDVLGVVFVNKPVGRTRDHVGWEDRIELLKWFKQNNIVVYPCADVADECCWTAYRGQLYIDVPPDETNSDYIKVRDHLKNPDGTMRYPDIVLTHLPLEIAMKNKHHDKSEFWDEWAKTF